MSITELRVKSCHVYILVSFLMFHCNSAGGLGPHATLVKDFLFYIQRRRKQSRARGAAALEKGTLFYISKKARTLKFRRLSVLACFY